MGITNTEYFLLFVTSYLLVGVLTPLMRKIALATNVVDNPNAAHKSHKQAVPYLGGVAIIIGIISISYSTSLVSNFTSNTFWLATSVLGPALLLGVIGLWDDLKNLKPLPRFIAQTVAGLFTAAVLILGNNVGNPTGSQIFDSIITVIWVVGICNSINFFDNLDGGAAGTVAISSIALAILALNGDQYLIAALSTVTAGATLGFLVWNKSPAKIYMGDAGALFLGVLLATLTVRFEPNAQTQVGSYLIPILLLAIPILDTTVAVLSRVRRHLSPFQGGQDHLSHRLIRAGLSRKQAAFSLWSLSAFFAAVAILISTTSTSVESYLVTGVGLLWIIMFILFFRTRDS
ncbi:MAG: undecaprenyl/decaprenyl-phosphate alpha-N-acetylglucosaminyl 1-phosphate transferase [Candidatus Nanopelagicus sp.]|nr:undecaprenyl/decaprenyl-phosphate alpha-N-acetylglucosaminyl 1-phosphate transferase [Candidatus Nanopelagicus sp.]